MDTGQWLKEHFMTQRIYSYLAPYKKQLLAVLFISLCLSVLTLADAWVMGRITDSVFYQTRGLPLSVNVKENTDKEFNLNLIRDSAWSSGEKVTLVKQIKNYGLTIVSAGEVGGNSIKIRVAAPQQVAKDPLKIATDLQKRLGVQYAHLQVYISANENSKPPTGFVLFPEVYTIYILPFLIILVYLLRGICSYGQNFLVGSIGQRIIMKLRNQIYENLQHLSISYFERNKTGQTGQLISRITNDIDAINFLFTSGIISMALQPLIVVIGLVWGFIINWKLTLLFFLVFPLIAFPIDRLTRKLRVVNSQIMNKLADITDVLEETLTGIKVVKAFGMEKHEIERFRKETKLSYQATLKSLQVGKMFLPVIEFMISIAIAIFLTYSGNQILHSQLSPSQFFTFIILMGYITNPIRNLSNVYSNFPKAMVAAERVFTLIDEKSEVVEAANPVELPQVAGKVEFEKVSFGYTPESVVLHNIDLLVNPGEAIALVGPSGAGKTTMINLVARFYDPVSGNIKIDGINLRDIKINSLRQVMGIVPQETVLFRGTVAENIAYGKINATMDEIIAAAKASNAHEFIEQMPEGYQTRVGSRGATLSGGQRQRIAIARALLRDPRLLILDEATSALDTQSEILVQDALQKLMKNRTCFVIAHRLSTIRSANRIVVMQGGKIVELGTHEELLQLDGLYAMLYKTQFRNQEGDSNVDG
jgi:ABC-type multidrug transport system, ATPase and permease components